jgi:hypothetical protein
MMIEKFESFEKKLDTQLSKHPIALQAERRLGHPKTRILMSFLLLMVALVVLYLNPEFAYMLIATAMPSFCTMQLLRVWNDSTLGSVGAGPLLKENKMEMWLAYWIIFSKLLLLETLGIGNLIPLYSVLRIVFVVWLQAPGFEGAQFIYEKGMVPVIHTLFKGGSSLSRSASNIKNTLREKKAEIEEKIEASSSPSKNIKSFQTSETSPSPRSSGRKEE